MPELAIDAIEAIEGYNPQVIGTETIDGKLCAVVEYAELSRLWVQ